jgi:hypothetical protein
MNTVCIEYIETKADLWNWTTTKQKSISDSSTWKMAQSTGLNLVSVWFIMVW